MKSGWPSVSLAELLRPISRPEPVKSDRVYQLLGAHWYAEGLYIKDTKSGSLIQADRLHRIEEGDFVYNRLFGWKGAFAVADQDDSGCYVSGEFPYFEVNRQRLDPTYLWRYFSRAIVWQEALGLSTGGTPTSRNRLKEDRLLAMTIPLPPLDEQFRIVARIEELAAKIEEARGLRREAVSETELLIPSALYRFFESDRGSWMQMPMAEAVSMNDRQVDPTLPPYSSLPHVSGENIESGTCQLLPCRTAEEDGVKSGNYLFSAGSILYSKIRPYLQKAVLVDFEGVCSADVYPVKVTSSELDTKFVMWSLVAGPFTGYANQLSGRTRMPKLNRRQFFGFKLKYPPLRKQRHIVQTMEDLRETAQAARRLQAETAAALDALLPSILDRAFGGEL